MVNLLAAAVEVTEKGGDKVVVDPMGPMLMSAVYLFLILAPLIIILLFFFYKKKLQNQQILAAMDKGLPVKDLLESPKKRETGWVPNISAGIGLLFVAVAALAIYYPAGIYQMTGGKLAALLAIPIVFAGLGITRLLRGLFQKASAKNTPQEEDDQDQDEEPTDTQPAALPSE